MRNSIKRALQRFGYDLVRYDPQSFFPKLATYLTTSGIDLFLDVGANGGSTGVFLRRIGYQGHIISYEPGAEAYALLQKTAQGDALWETSRTAIGDRDGEIDLFVSSNLLSSSTRAMLDAHVEAHSDSRYVATERVKIQTLEAALSGRLQKDSKVFLKIDVQGAEDAVLRGGAGILGRVQAIQLEMSLIPLYAGQMLLPELLQHMSQLGFHLYAVNHAFEADRTGQLLQLDGVFVRAEPLSAPSISTP